MSNTNIECQCTHEMNSHVKEKHGYGGCQLIECKCDNFTPRDDYDILDGRDAFDKVLIELRALHNKKKADYSNPEDRFSNFRVAGAFSGVETFRTIEVLIGVKQARLIELMTPGREVQNEPIGDTLLDRAVYSILALLYRRQNK